ncbi:hypothetical protein C8F01DRAFT_1381125 [Mycena amicta]|nr:hypothetical protein C8F01DRAFT_1381125 [Mycena amicta]
MSKAAPGHRQQLPFTFHCMPLRPLAPRRSLIQVAAVLQRRTRSGATFSEVVLDRVDVATLLATRLVEQDAVGHYDPDVEVLSGQPLPDDWEDELLLKPSVPASTLDVTSPSTAPEPPKKRAAAAPYIKGVGAQRVREAKKHAVHVKADTADLPHSKPAWTGHTHAPGPDPKLAASLDGFDWTQDNLNDALRNVGMRYIDSPNGPDRDSVPIYNAHHRLLALFAGHPRGQNWSAIVTDANEALEAAAPHIRLSAEKRAHRRAADEFPALARGISHGGGQTAPGELLIHGQNKCITDELLKNAAFKSIVGFTTYIFQQWMPLLFGAFHLANLALSDVFAACTWNFVTTVCAPHVDFGNLAWGWCAITALGRFNPDRGGHLILWDLRLVIRFPPGSTIFIPSVLLLHSNSPIRPGETRSSFVQYSAGGLFRWIDQGFQSQDAFLQNASEENLAAAEERAPCELVIQRSPHWNTANLDARDAQHDKNVQGYWYLVLGFKIFTRKHDVDAIQTPYYERYRTKAEAIAAANDWCRKRCTQAQRCGVAPMLVPASAVPTPPPFNSRSYRPKLNLIAPTPGHHTTDSQPESPISIPSSQGPVSIPSTTTSHSSPSLSSLSSSDLERSNPYDDETPESIEQNNREMLPFLRTLYAADRAEYGLLDSRVHNAVLRKRQQLRRELTREEEKEVARRARAERARELHSGVELGVDPQFQALLPRAVAAASSGSGSASQRSQPPQPPPPAASKQGRHPPPPSPATSKPSRTAATTALPTAFQPAHRRPISPTQTSSPPIYRAAPPTSGLEQGRLEQLEQRLRRVNIHIEVDIEA